VTKEETWIDKERRRPFVMAGADARLATQYECHKQLRGLADAMSYTVPLGPEMALL